MLLTESSGNFFAHERKSPLSSGGSSPRRRKPDSSFRGLPMTLVESVLRVDPPLSAGRRALIVDDDALTLETLQSILAGAGFDAVCADDVQAGRDRLRSQPFDVVLTDLYLAGGSGYEIAAAARALQPRAPVVMLTGRPSFGAAAEALRSNVREIVVKPIDAQILVATCERAIRTAEMERRTRELETQNRVLTSVLPRLIEAKDPTTSGHSERVVQYVDRLAQRCGIEESDREMLRLAALLHDIGKIAVPQSILCKDGPLAAEERAVIMCHPQVGHDVLAGLEGCDPVRRWVLQHHERWDGRGYPNGLAGEEVDLPGRILILAEVYDALAEARSYKPAWPLLDIVEFFRNQAGKHFDPCLAMLVADGLEREGRAFFDADLDAFDAPGLN
ncbi:MAG: response regulator [Planctomycetes bacterium]|nr:response regulator [Planctomycetota bacterium]